MGKPRKSNKARKKERRKIHKAAHMEVLQELAYRRRRDKRINRQGEKEAFPRKYQDHYNRYVEHWNEEANAHPGVQGQHYGRTTGPMSYRNAVRMFDRYQMTMNYQDEKNKRTTSSTGPGKTSKLPDFNFAAIPKLPDKRLRRLQRRGGIVYGYRQ
jgi:hypothetical protein